MREVPVHYLAVLIAAVIYMVIGFLWYSPYILGNQWMKLTGRTKAELEKEQKKMGPLFGLSFLAAVVMAYVLTHSITFARDYFGMTGVTPGIMTAFWSWLGFVGPVQITAVIFEKQPVKLFAIHTGYQLVGLLAMGVVLALWK